MTTHTLRKCEMPPGGTKALFGSSTESTVPARAAPSGTPREPIAHPREPSRCAGARPSRPSLVIPSLSRAGDDDYGLVTECYIVYYNIIVKQKCYISTSTRDGARVGLNIRLYALASHRSWRG